MITLKLLTKFALITDKSHQGLIAKPTFDLNEPIEAPFINSRRPNMAILREQGVNGHIEMAAAFDKVGFNTIDVHERLTCWSCEPK